MAEVAMQRLLYRIARQQLAAQHLAGGEGGVGDLQQQEAEQVVALQRLEADDRPAAHRHHGGDQRPRVEPAGQGVVEQGHVDRREHGEQQHLGHRQHGEAAVQAQVGDAELQRAGQPEAGQQPPRQAAPDGERQEHQGGDQHPRQHGEVAVHLAGQVLADQAEGEGPEQGDGEQVGHGSRAPRDGTGADHRPQRRPASSRAHPGASQLRLAPAPAASRGRSPPRPTAACAAGGPGSRRCR
ncbi:hypothetical protein D9M71_110020 [compost metagenome]